MSYQPQPPTGGLPPTPPTAPQPGYAPAPPSAVYSPAGAAAPPPPQGQRRKGLIIAGVITLVAGLVAGGAIAVSAAGVTESTVEKFARAPVGCTTTLEFEKAATFTLFLETKGSAVDVGGDCAGNGSTYDRADDDPPNVSLTLVDENDNPVELTESSAYSYDTGTFVGQAIQQVEISTPGTYRLKVASEENDFAIAVGGDPEADSDTLLAIGGAVIVIGLLVGIVLIVLGLRRKQPPSAAAAPAVPGAGWAGQPSAAAAPVSTPTPPPPAYQPPPQQAPAAPRPPITPGPPGPPGPPGSQGWGAPQA